MDGGVQLRRLDDRFLFAPASQVSSNRQTGEETVWRSEGRVGFTQIHGSLRASTVFLPTAECAIRSIRRWLAMGH